jgi:tripartite-type tricarboxylate transporter receptor subunit TctC
MLTKRKTALILSLLLVLTSFVGCSQESEEVSFPEKDIEGYIMWGAGGATDNVSRAYTPHVEKHIDASIVLQNKTGATGAVATQFVYNKPADGYTLLFGAENPQLYKVLDLSEIDYDNYDPVILLGMSVAVVVVPTDSPYETFEDVIEDAKTKPGEIEMGSTGPGGLPFVAAGLIKAVNDVEFNLVPFDGEGPALTAMMGGHVDITVAGLSAARELIRSGDVKPLAVISNDTVPGLEEITPISEIYEGYEAYLPWGPYYGVFAKKGTPEEVMGILEDAFLKGFQEEEYQDFLVDFGAVPLGYQGEEAREFIERSQKIAAWLMYDAGATEKSPEEFGIERLE